MDVPELVAAIAREFVGFFEFSIWPIPGVYRGSAKVDVAGNARIAAFGFLDLFLASYVYGLLTTGRFVPSIGATAYPFAAAILVWLLWLVTFLMRPADRRPSQTEVFAAVVYGLAPSAFWGSLASALVYGLALLIAGSDRAYYSAELTMIFSSFPIAIYGSFVAFKKIDFSRSIRLAFAVLAVATSLLTFSAAYVMLSSGGYHV